MLSALIPGSGLLGGRRGVDRWRFVLFDLGGLFAGRVDVVFDAGKVLLGFDDTHRSIRYPQAQCPGFLLGYGPALEAGCRG